MRPRKKRKGEDGILEPGDIKDTPGYLIPKTSFRTGGKQRKSSSCKKYSSFSTTTVVLGTLGRARDRACADSGCARVDHDPRRKNRFVEIDATLTDRSGD
ncbi:hypothetical protein EVAR_21974_1 [Eumeta japonica]|uniref:Uncharacterized protein n=1 Tax=Eumeta variegata TaxID=151549 RepID=A0A4C1VWV4_EUMVA|nr:hypothetical protein EVAR_21974_1 [Eumeta japonica]